MGANYLFLEGDPPVIMETISKINAAFFVILKGYICFYDDLEENKLFYFVSCHLFLWP